MAITASLDTRFSEATAPVDWGSVADLLTCAELYWLSTVRADGRPHVTPLVGLWTGQAFVFCTGPTEQKAHNLAHGAAVAVTTGTNTWHAGLDAVVEGTAQRVRGRDRLTALAAAYRAKYGEDWTFDCDDQTFSPGENAAYVFEVAPAKVLAFAKAPHGQTSFRF